MNVEELERRDCPSVSITFAHRILSILGTGQPNDKVVVRGEDAIFPLPSHDAVVVIDDDYGGRVFHNVSRIMARGLLEFGNVTTIPVSVFARSGGLFFNYAPYSYIDAIGVDYAAIENVGKHSIVRVVGLGDYVEDPVDRFFAVDYAHLIDYGNLRTDRFGLFWTF